jgi:hypothetical protein
LTCIYVRRRIVNMDEEATASPKTKNPELRPTQTTQQRKAEPPENRTAPRQLNNPSESGN